MTKKRVSNEQILSALSETNANIAALVGVLAGKVGEQVTAPSTLDAEPAPAPAPVAPAVSNSADQPSPQYVKVMAGKAQAHANKHGQPVVLYARRKVSTNELKLAFCTEDEFPFRSRAHSFIGRVGSVFNPQ